MLRRHFAAILLIQGLAASGQSAGVSASYACISTTTTLPNPTHSVAFGYYFTAGTYGDFRDEVAEYTDLDRTGKYDFPDTTKLLSWLPAMERGIRSAWLDGRKICLALEWGVSDAPTDEADAESLLKAIKPYWNQVLMIELADEPAWDKDETEQRLRRLIKAQGLRIPPIGITFTRRQLMHEEVIFARGLDYVGIECYIDPPGSDDAEANVEELVRYVTNAKNRVPADKQLVLVMMAYARNDNWTNIETLKALQLPVYLLAYDDPRVIAIMMFSYGRRSGTREHPELKSVHQAIGRALGIGEQADPTASPN